MSKLDELEKKVSEIERLCRELSDKRFLEDIHDELCENLKKHQDSSGSHFIKEIVSRIEMSVRWSRQYCRFTRLEEGWKIKRTNTIRV